MSAPKNERAPHEGGTLEHARCYLARGWAPIPIPRGKKGPVLKGWQNLRLGEDQLPGYFVGECNIGLLLGDPSGGLVDVDLDAPEAIELAPSFLPPTDMRHGRPGKPGSHGWYRVTGATKVVRYQDPLDGTTLVELRGKGGQTLVPPSLHPSGDELRWEAEGDPAAVELAHLQERVVLLAAVSLLRRHAPDHFAECLATLGIVMGEIVLPSTCRPIEELVDQQIAARIAQWLGREPAVELALPRAHAPHLQADATSPPPPTAPTPDLEPIRDLVARLPQSLAAWMWLGGVAAKNGVLEHVRSLAPDEANRRALEEGAASRGRLPRPCPDDALLRKIDRELYRLTRPPAEEDGGWEPPEGVPVIQSIRRNVAGHRSLHDIAIESRGRVTELVGLTATQVASYRSIRVLALEQGVDLPPFKGSEAYWADQLASARELETVEPLPPEALLDTAIEGAIGDYLGTAMRGEEAGSIEEGRVVEQGDRLLVKGGILVREIRLKLIDDQPSREDIARAARRLGMESVRPRVDGERPRAWSFPRTVIGHE